MTTTGGSLRREPGLSATIVVVLAIAAGLFCTAVMHALRVSEQGSGLPASLHEVEIVQDHGTVRAAFGGTNAERNIDAARARLSYPMYRLLAASRLDARQTATFRARVLVAGSDDARGRLPLEPRNARFAHADFFVMFALPFRHGGPWSRDEDARGAAVVVLSKLLNERLFGGANSVGRTVLVDDRRFEVVGVLANDQPFAPEWDPADTGGPQDLLFLPFAEHERLQARPEAPFAEAPEGPSYADLLRSETPWVSFWIDLPTPALRAAYAAYLERRLGAAGLGRPYALRDLAAVRAERGSPKTVLTFFVFLTFLVLASAGLVVTRLLFAKGLARRGEVSITRASSAPRAAVMGRQLLEAALLALLGGTLSMAVAGPAAYVYNRLVADTDIPLVITPFAFFVTVSTTLAVTLVFALYPAWRAATHRPRVGPPEVVKVRLELGPVLRMLRRQPAVLTMVILEIAVGIAMLTALLLAGSRYAAIGDKPSTVDEANLILVSTYTPGEFEGLVVGKQRTDLARVRAVAGVESATAVSVGHEARLLARVAPGTREAVLARVRDALANDAAGRWVEVR